MSSGTKSMYSLKPIIDLPDKIPLPKVMYELPKIQGGPTGSKSESIIENIHRQVVHPEYNLLEARQMRILAELCKLREEFDCLYTQVQVASDLDQKPSAGTKVQGSQKPVTAELVLYANPASPPYSILALQKIWKDTKFNVQVHKHSTVHNAPTDTFEQKLLKISGSDTVHNIDVKLIWKEVQDVQLITKVQDYSLEGEANVLRYLTRLTEKYRYENDKQLVESSLIDSVLDLSLKLPFEEPRNINAITSKFANYLDKNPWLLNATTPSIVDVAVWSTIKRFASNKVPRELKNWYDLSEKTFLSV